MSVEWINVELEKWIWNSSGAQGTDLLLLHTINTFASSEGARCWPSLPMLSARSGLNEKTIRKGLKRLEEMGVLTIELRNRRPSVLTIVTSTGTEIGSTKSGTSSSSSSTKNGSVYSQKRHLTGAKSGTRTNNQGTKATWTPPEAAHVDDGHEHRPDKHGNCVRCNARIFYPEDLTAGMFQEVTA